MFKLKNQTHYLQVDRLYRVSSGSKRLGDGFYEQKLIREQINQLTGRRFLSGYANDQAQYQALMNSGVTSAKAFNLTPGVSLSASQIAQLTSDIVWLVEQTIILPAQYDSTGKLIKAATTTKALVPHVYVAVKAGDLNANGALISADSINLNISSDLTNSNCSGSIKLETPIG